MAKFVLALLAAMAMVLIALGAWRWTDKKADQAVWAGLASHQPPAPAVFDPAMVSGLPAPAQRFFRFAIAPGTPLYTVTEFSMQGEFSLGSKAESNYMPMQAEQILAAPYGFIWKIRAGDAVWFTGSDGANDEISWSRFWLFGIVSVARAGNNEDHARAAFGRYVAEAVFWTPAALLPGDNVLWEPIDDTTARVIVTHSGLEQAVDVSVEPDCRPSKVVFQRPSNANLAQVFQPFGGYLSTSKTSADFACQPGSRPGISLRPTITSRFSRRP